jgi:hypothetical protein
MFEFTREEPHSGGESGKTIGNASFLPVLGVGQLHWSEQFCAQGNSVVKLLHVLVNGIQTTDRRSLVVNSI